MGGRPRVYSGEDEKFCSKCNTLKPIGDFYKNKSRRDGKAVFCKTCWEKEYVGKRAEVKKVQLQHKYGVTWENYLEVLDYQEYKCAICKRDINAAGTRDTKSDTAHIDHDHETGKLRGILCTQCNSGLGSFRDSIASLQNAIKYLETYSI